ncbi:putative tRNA pseudouridine synthase 1 isoform 2 [Scophthalmus maximus]|uniref:Pseudouridylate synthase TRUB1 n=1 Tax=Scophthalmus maximus TaxID=52904 RepID=A0A2U9CKX0_SCOMX|nr:probable tRNA pseudouridine synthase 1 [Scophthalmus maximus]AWP17178.1 putative tRNA pseudouridine synthase 1 isoform 2 [Scophthalmus maximus]
MRERSMAGNLSNSAAPLTSSLSKLQALNGLFAIHKKQGPTSADVLNMLKEALLKEAGVKNPNPRKRKKQSLKLGHGGTLDSAASGVLVVGVGNGTKMLSTMLAGSKKYVAVGELGKATDTLDATGKMVLEKDFEHITRVDIEEKLKSFTGDIMQVPPLYSALKKDGQRLSVLLQKGHKVEAKPARPVTVYNLTLQEFKPPLFTLDIECGGGFYVRSLVDDLGKALSSCAHVKELVRTKQGQFTLEEHALHEGQWTLEHVLRSLQPCSESETGTKPSKEHTD